MVDTDITATHPVTAAEEDAGHKITGIGADYTAVEPTVILQMIVGQMEYVPIRANIAGH